MKLLRLTTVPISLRLLLTGQMHYMRQNGLEVIMVSADGPEREVVQREEGCPHRIIPFTRTITPLQDLRCLWQLIMMMRELRPDIVHTHTPKAGLLGMLAARILGVPVRIHTIAGLPFMTATGFKRRLLMAMERLTYWGAQHVWPNSPSMLAYVRQQGLCPQRKLDIIGHGSTNGIDLGVFSPEAVSEARREAVRHQIGYQTDSTYLMAIGRVVRDKGIPELVAAFTRLRPHNQKIKLVLVGPLEEERSEELLPPDTLHSIRQHPDILHVHWTDDVPAFLTVADLLVHASHREGFPNVLLQAGAMRCPIVCSAIPGNIDIVENNVTGLTFPVGDAKALKEVLQRALWEEAMMRQMTTNLREIVAQRFERNTIHQALFEKYQTLI